jgi:hypothetical protein
MLFFQQRFCPWAASLLFLAIPGCGDSGPTIVPVSGTMTFKGKPVANALVTFMPEHGRPSSAQTDDEGRFTLSYDREHEGVLVGKHKVWISPSKNSRPTTAAEQKAAIMGKKLPPSREMAAFFEKYDQKNSKVEVVIDKNTRELKLDWD